MKYEYSKAKVSGILIGRRDVLLLRRARGGSRMRIRGTLRSRSGICTDSSASAADLLDCNEKTHNTNCPGNSKAMLESALGSDIGAFSDYMGAPDEGQHNNALNIGENEIIRFSPFNQCDAHIVEKLTNVLDNINNNLQKMADNQKITDNYQNINNNLQKMADNNQKIADNYQKMTDAMMRIEAKIQTQSGEPTNNSTQELLGNGRKCRYACHKCVNFACSNKKTLKAHQRACKEQSGRQKRGSNVMYMCGKCKYSRKNRSNVITHESNCKG